MIDEPSSYLDVRQRLKAAQVRTQAARRSAGRRRAGWRRPCAQRPRRGGRHVAFTRPFTRPSAPPSPCPPKTIRDLLDIKNYVIVVEHDLSGEAGAHAIQGNSRETGGTGQRAAWVGKPGPGLCVCWAARSRSCARSTHPPTPPPTPPHPPVLDYLSDFICCLYGKPGAYGVVTLPFSVREGINIFLAGALVGASTGGGRGCSLTPWVLAVPHRAHRPPAAGLPRRRFARPRSLSRNPPLCPPPPTPHPTPRQALSPPRTCGSATRASRSRSRSRTSPRTKSRSSTPTSTPR
jgi:hypothetical protein